MRRDRNLQSRRRGRRWPRTGALLGAAIAVFAVGSGVASAYPTVPAQIWTVAGIGTAGYTGDGGAATSAELNHPYAVAPTPDGGYLIADFDNNVIRKVSADGTITTVAGNGTAGYAGDGGPATAAELDAPRSVAPLPGGGFLVADSGNNVIREVSATGTITTVAGTGVAGYAGDGGPAASAELNLPTGVAPTSDGGYLIADFNNNVIRKVSATGTITTVAGNGTAGFAGDGGAATGAELYHAANVAPTADGGYLIADSGNYRIRKVSATGTITTVAGTGASDSVAGLGGPAVNAAINDPWDVAVEPNGGYLIAEYAGQMIAQVSPTGIITDVAGAGVAQDGGDGGSAYKASLNSPVGVAVTPDGGFLIADSGNSRIRWVTGPSAGPTGATGAAGASGATGAAGAPGDSGSAGPAGSTGAAGSTGPAGSAGAPGSTGPAGPTGSTGAQGPAGKVELVTCSTVTKTVHGHRQTAKRCKAKLVSGTVKFTTAQSRFRAALSRLGEVYATGTGISATRAQALVLTTRRQLTRGSYTLTLRTRHAHRWVTQKTRIKLG